MVYNEKDINQFEFDSSIEITRDADGNITKITKDSNQGILKKEISFVRDADNNLTELNTTITQ